MRYLGGKSKIARKTAEVVLSRAFSRRLLVEPFVGGGAMTEALSPAFNLTLAGDTHPDLIEMYRALQNGWQPPTSITEGEYSALRDAATSALRGFVGFGGSFGGKWFGGFARGGDRNYLAESAKSLKRLMSSTGATNYVCAGYDRAWVERDAVVYCDPPYAGTTGYKDAFCPATFWRQADAWAASGAQVFVSEYQAPEHWVPVWEETRTRDMRSDLLTAAKVTERLFVPREQS